jgi:hypothetical protein
MAVKKNTNPTNSKSSGKTDYSKGVMGSKSSTLPPVKVSTFYGSSRIVPATTTTKTDKKTTTKIDKETKKTPVKDTASAAALAEAERLRLEAEAEAERLRNRIVVDDTEERIDSIAYLQDLFAQYGIPELANKIVELKNQGLTDRVVAIELQKTPEFKARFIGNENRKKAGLPPLDPGTYIATETAYKKVMRDSQLPIGFYDQYDDFAKFIGGDVSPAELQERLNIANQSIQNADPYYTDSLRRLYGLQSGDMLAYTLDPERALPFITRQQKAAQFGAEAARQGLQVTTPMAETYSGQLGVTQQEARQGFEQVAQILPEAQRLSAITPGSQPVGFEETTSAIFGGAGSAEYKQKLQKLAQEEQSRFAGQTGVGRTSLSRGTAGQF